MTLSTLSHLVTSSLDADELAAWTSAEHTSTATHVMQETINRVSSWADEWCMDINCSKIQATLFSLSTVKAGKQVDNPTFQGVILDTRLMWKTHLEAVAARSISQLGLLKILAGTTWGLHRSSLSHHGVCHNLLGHHFKCQQEQAGQSPKCPITSHCWCHKNNTHHGEGEQNRPGAPGTPKNI